MQKVINCIVLVFLLLFICAATVQSYRLERNRRELEQVRNELECARDRTSDIRDSLRRTNEILSESRTTVQGIREQIAEIKKQYEVLESYCDSFCISSDNINNHYDN